jgi:phosphoribosylglycinamide formyltransferase-1
VEHRAPAPLVPRPARIAVLLSGRGSNFLALADACERGDVPARVTLVVSDNPQAQGLVHARRRGIAVSALPRRAFPSKTAHEEAIAAEIVSSRADLICLAGFMRLLSPSFVERFAMRVLNIHPALLPSFPGLDAQGQALRYGVQVSGATVHFVDAGTDTGPIVAQEAVPVHASDDVETLSHRILDVEHRLYPRALGMVLAGGWWLDGRRIRFPQNPVQEKP